MQEMCRGYNGGVFAMKSEDRWEGSGELFMGGHELLLKHEWDMLWMGSC